MEPKLCTADEKRTTMWCSGMTGDGQGEESRREAEEDLAPNKAACPAVDTERKSCCGWNQRKLRSEEVAGWKIFWVGT